MDQIHTYTISFTPLVLKDEDMVSNVKLLESMHRVSVYYASIGPASARFFLRMFGGGGNDLLAYRAVVTSELPPRIELTMATSSAVPEANLQAMVNMVPDVSFDGSVPMGRYDVAAMNPMLWHREGPPDFY